jgi:predicted aspartyl protease
MTQTKEVLIEGRPISELVLIGTSYYSKEDGDFVAEKIDQGFMVNDLESLDNVMERIFNAEAVLAMEKRKAEAVLKNMQVSIKKAEDRVKFLREFFGSSIENFSKTQLVGQSKYVQSAYGRIQFTTYAGGKLEVKDSELALKYAERLKMKNAVKVTKSFLISQLTEKQSKQILTLISGGIDELEDDIERNASLAFGVTSTRTTCSIKTGLA